MGLLISNARKLKFLEKVQKGYIEKREWKDVLSTSDVDFIKLCVQIKPDVINSFPEKWRNDKEVMSIVTRYGGVISFDYVGEELKKDKDFMEKAFDTAVRHDLFSASEIFVNNLYAYIVATCKLLPVYKENKKIKNINVSGIMESGIKDTINEAKDAMDNYQDVLTKIQNGNGEIINRYYEYCDRKLLKQLMEINIDVVKKTVKMIKTKLEIFKGQNEYREIVQILEGEYEGIKNVLSGTNITQGDNV